MDLQKRKGLAKDQHENHGHSPLEMLEIIDKRSPVSAVCWRTSLALVLRFALPSFGGGCTST